MQIDGLEIVMKNIDDIIPYWRNPRKNDKTVDALVPVIEKNGFNVPIVIDRNNVVVKGHARLKAARRMGMTQVPCVISNASDEVIKADRIADNKIQELSRWDFGKLEFELNSIGDDMSFGNLFRPEENPVKNEVFDIPVPDFKPVGIDFAGDFDFSEPSREAHHDEYYAGESEFYAEHHDGGEEHQFPVEVGAVNVKRKYRTLCPYCGKVVVIDI